MSDVVDFLLIARLRVAKEDDIKRCRLIDLDQRKVDRGRQRSGRINAGEVQLWRTVWLVNVIEPGNVQRIDHGAITTGFDHKDDRVIVDRQGIPSILVGRNHIFPVRDADSRQARLIGVTLLILVFVFENDSLRRLSRGRLGLSLGCGLRQCGNGNEGNSDPDGLHASEFSV